MMTERTESGQTGLLPGMPELQALDPDLPARLKADLDEAEEKAWDSLARYKFQMFGYRSLPLDDPDLSGAVERRESCEGRSWADGSDPQGVPPL